MGRLQNTNGKKNAMNVDIVKVITIRADQEVSFMNI
jgi:hypothetical protein